jgi:hypothetical protein
MTHCKENQHKQNPQRAQRLRLAGLLALAVATPILALGQLSRPGTAQGTAGNIIFSGVGHYKVLAGPSAAEAADFQDANIAAGGSKLQDAEGRIGSVELSIDSGARVAAAYLGVSSDYSVNNFASNAFADFDVSFDGTVVSTVPVASSTILEDIVPSGPQIGMPMASISQYADITSLVAANGSGLYRIENPMVTFSPTAWRISSPYTFAFAVVEDPSYPLAAVVVNDYFHSTAVRGEDNYIPLNLPLPSLAADQQFGAVATLSGHSGTTDDPEEQSGATYQALSASGQVLSSGELINTNYERFFTPFSWNNAPASIDPQTATLMIDIWMNIGDSVTSTTTGMMILTVPVEPRTPGIPDTGQR